LSLNSWQIILSFPSSTPGCMTSWVRRESSTWVNTCGMLTQMLSRWTFQGFRNIDKWRHATRARGKYSFDTRCEYVSNTRKRGAMGDIFGTDFLAEYEDVSLQSCSCSFPLKLHLQRLL
jgi:hypothetical protein